MSADRENHDMAQTDIALLLAEAADEVEIGIAPVQAVVRGGRRRRTRRWAVTAATALALTGSTGVTLALAGLPASHHAARVAPAATRPASPQERHVYAPQRTELGRGVYRGTQWRVEVQVWGAPADRQEAGRQYDAMARLGIEPAVDEPADLVGKLSYFVTRVWGDHRPQQVMYDTVRSWDHMAGGDLNAIATRLGSTPESSGRLVIGRVARTATQVKCVWNDGDTLVTTTEGAAGSPVNWFLCVAPEGKSYREAEVIQ